MQELTILLPDETVNYLQRLDYELGGLQVLHTHALNAGAALEKRVEIRREYQELFAEYQLAKQEMWAQFAPRFPDTQRWWVDFQTGELHVVGGNPSTTACGGGPPPFHKGGTGNCPPDNSTTGAEVNGDA